METIASLSLAWWEIVLAGISTLAIYSFLYRENPYYRFFEHIFIGIATGWGIVASVRYFIWPLVFKPLLGYDRIVFPDGTASEPYNPLILLYIVPICFGLLYYFILSRKHSWLAQLVIGFQLGCAGGLAFKGTFNELLPQIFDSFRPVLPNFSDLSGTWAEALTNAFFMLTLLSSMMYFFFTFKRTPGSLISRSSYLGRWLMMGCFGAFFGSTIMARMALLVERLDFLIHSWLPALGSLL